MGLLKETKMHSLSFATSVAMTVMLVCLLPHEVKGYGRYLWGAHLNRTNREVTWSPKRTSTDEGFRRFYKLEITSALIRNYAEGSGMSHVVEAESLEYNIEVDPVPPVKVRVPIFELEPRTNSQNFQTHQIFFNPPLVFYDSVKLILTGDNSYYPVDIAGRQTWDSFMPE